MRRLKRLSRMSVLALGLVGVPTLADRASGQDYGTFRAGTVYVPYGGGSGGFLPYSPGPGGGLGILGGATASMGRGPVSGGSPEMFTGGSATMASGLGALNTSLLTLSPVRAAGPAMGMGGGLVRRPTRGGMNAAGRPMVGGYPFRQPPSLSGPGSGMGR